MVDGSDLAGSLVEDMLIGMVMLMPVGLFVPGGQVVARGQAGTVQVFGHRQRERTSCLLRWQVHPPAPVRVGAHLPHRAVEGDRDLLARVRETPDRHGPPPLEDHVVAEQRGQTGVGSRSRRRSEQHERRLRRALALSRNLVAVRLITKVGPELVARYANVMGITDALQPIYSLALGSVEVTARDRPGLRFISPSRSWAAERSGMRKTMNPKTIVPSSIWQMRFFMIVPPFSLFCILSPKKNQYQH